MIDFNALKAEFAPDFIDWRVGPTNKDKTKGMALAYIDARLVMDRLDQVCGPENWQCRYSHAEGKTVCEIGINVHGTSQQRIKPEDDGSIVVDTLWVWKADGAGDTDMEADKGALSAAFKRAAVRWGIGRYLYDVNSPWVEIEGFGKSFKIKDGEFAKLRNTLTGGAAPSPKPDRPAVPAAAAAPTAGAPASFQLVDPNNPGRIAMYPKAAAFVAALREKMESEDPVQWWAVNGSTARHIADSFKGTKHEAQATADYTALEQLAISNAA